MKPTAPHFKSETILKFLVDVLLGNFLNILNYIWLIWYFFEVLYKSFILQPIFCYNLRARGMWGRYYFFSNISSPFGHKQKWNVVMAVCFVSFICCGIM